MQRDGPASHNPAEFLEAIDTLEDLGVYCYRPLRWELELKQATRGPDAVTVAIDGEGAEQLVYALAALAQLVRKRHPT